MKTKRWALALACVVGAAALAAIGIQLSRPERPAGSLKALYAMAAREGHVPRASGYLTREGVGRLADGNPLFRDWLLGLVKDETADSDIRLDAFGLLMRLQDPAAKGRVLSDLVAWVGTQKGEGPKATLGFRMSAYIPTQVLLTELPDAEALRLIQQARPKDWREFVEPHASKKADAPSGLLPEYQARATARAREILAYADSAVHTTQPPEAAAEPQPKPDQPPAPAK